MPMHNGAADMAMTAEIEIRLRASTDLPELLGAGFNAFESIRLLARSCEDRSPGLLAAFMTTADAAVDGREAITAAPALSMAVRSSCPAGECVPDVDAIAVADSLAALGTLLGDLLTDGAAAAATAEDHAACRSAVRAARRISSLMAGGDHDHGSG
jgi:hypothetical protein